MNSRNDPTDGRPTDPIDAEARIRADERARVEQELSRRGDDRPAGTADGVPDDRVAADERALADDRAAAEGRAPTDDRATAGDRGLADDRPLADDRHDRDRDGVDDRVERNDRGRDDDRVRDDRRDTPVGGAPLTDRDRGTTDRDTLGRNDRLVGDDERVIRADEPIEVVRTRSFSIGQLLTMLAGAALIVLGVVALVDTGVDTPLDEQVGEVLGWSHTALLGIVEIVAGALLLIFSLRPGGRWLVAVVGLALVVGGVLILGELDFTVDTLGAEQSFGWVPIVAGLIALFASLVTPRRHQRMTGIPADR